MAAPALFFRYTSATGWNNAFINFDKNGWFPAPNYAVFELWREHFLPDLIKLEGDTKGFNIVATMLVDKKRSCLKIVNPFVLILKEGTKCGNVVWKVVGTFSLKEVNSMKCPDRIKVEWKDVSVKGDNIILDIPAYSASVLTLEK